MLATNVFNNALEVDLDEYLEPYGGVSRTYARARARRSEMVEREFEGRVAFITGAAHGQGRATALALARAGARIAAFDVAKPLAYPGYEMGSGDDLRSAPGRVPGGRGRDCLPVATATCGTTRP